MRVAIPPLHQYAFMAGCLVKHRDFLLFIPRLLSVVKWTKDQLIPVVCVRNSKWKKLLNFLWLKWSQFQSWSYATGLLETLSYDMYSTCLLKDAAPNRDCFRRNRLWLSDYEWWIGKDFVGLEDWQFQGTDPACVWTWRSWSNRNEEKFIISRSGASFTP
jgi:hypothetical protein